MEQVFTAAANAVARGAGKPLTFAACCALILVWIVSGPFMGFSETWQLLINTATTIITFLMVFLIQNTQNRDGVAIQAKLDELIRVSDGRNRFIGIEHLPESEVERFRQLCEKALTNEENSRIDLEKNIRLEVERKSPAAVRKRPATLVGGKRNALESREDVGRSLS
ncbi:MAG TPA: low affinity iron permease family protein [Rhizobiaceae bacterium]|nr:low affinity iron permease family protein [Rhizobiaceae bacterium]